MINTNTIKTISAINLQSDLNYIGIIEHNNIRMIAGQSTYTNYEGVEVTKVMHVIIYNTITKEIIYSTGNNLRLNLDNLLQYAEDNLTVLEKYINDKFYLNEFMESFFYVCKFNDTYLSAIKIKKDIAEKQTEQRRQQTAIEREQLEQKLKDVCRDKQILIIEYLDEFILLHDKQLATRQDSKTFLEFLLELIESNTTNKYKELQSIKIERLQYTSGNSLNSNLEAIELLKKHIEYIKSIN
jgi:hypothetical protein